jgi:hypothetical protein
VVCIKNKSKHRTAHSSFKSYPSCFQCRLGSWWCDEAPPPHHIFISFGFFFPSKLASLCAHCLLPSFLVCSPVVLLVLVLDLVPLRVGSLFGSCTTGCSQNAGFGWLWSLYSNKYII